MGTDDLFKKKQRGRKAREHDVKEPKANSYLIVTEGKRTEPYYFGGLRDQVVQKVGGNVSVVDVPIIDISGEGCSTMALIRKTEKILNRSPQVYQNVWLVFDKDDCTDFDAAIAEAERKGYHVAWSNQSFEYWLYLHFDYSDAALHRQNWNKKLSDLFALYEIRDKKYRKNYKDIYQIVDSYGSVEAAINHAFRRMNDHRVRAQSKPSLCDPGTTVHLLTKELCEFLK